MQRFFIVCQHHQCTASLVERLRKKQLIARTPKQARRQFASCFCHVNCLSCCEVTSQIQPIISPMKRYVLLNRVFRWLAAIASLWGRHGCVCKLEEIVKVPLVLLAQEELPGRTTLPCGFCTSAPSPFNVLQHSDNRLVVIAAGTLRIGVFRWSERLG